MLHLMHMDASDTVPYLQHKLLLLIVLCAECRQCQNSQPAIAKAIAMVCVYMSIYICIFVSLLDEQQMASHQ
jgi:hypothetical protein